MRIAINARILQKGILEGVGRYIWETTQRLIIEHPEHTFYLFFDRTYDDKYIVSDNVVPIVLQPQARHPLLFIAWFEWSVRRALAKYKIDVFVSGDNFLCLGTSVPTVLVLHDLAYRHYPEHINTTARWYYQYFMPRFLQRADRIIVVSEYVKNDAKREFPLIDGSKYRVGYNALPKRPNSGHSRLREGEYYVYLGSLHPRKNIYGLLKGFESMLEAVPDAHLIIIGRDAGISTATRDLLQQMQDRGKVSHLTDVVDEDINTWLTHAKGLIYVSLFEGFGIPIVEAMAVGTPVITSDTTSMPEVAGGAALLVPPTDHVAIGRVMVRLWNDEELRGHLVDKGYSRAQAFDWDRTSNELYAAIQEVGEGEHS